MKRLLAAALAFIMMMSLCCQVAFAEEEDDYNNLFFFGHYPLEDKDNYYGDQAIGWWILYDDEEAEKALLISFYAIDTQVFDVSGASWENSSIRHWLNNDFYYSAFTEEEQQMILTTTVKNGKAENYSEWDTDGSKDTEDKVFLLSAAESLKYLPDRSKCYYTPYAQDAAGKIFKETGSYWLRSPGKKSGEMAIFDNGKIASMAAKKTTGVCPAIWVDYSQDMSNLPFERLSNAFELEDDHGEYLQAFEIYDSLGTYEYGYYYAAEALLKYALESEGNDEEIIQRLQSYHKYCNEHELTIDETKYDVSSYELLNEAYYNLAVKAQENGEYERAMEFYSKVGQYKDAANRLIECYKKYGIQYKYMDATLVNAGKKNGNYAEAKGITRDDVDRGCELGSFIISGYTEKEEGRDRTIFIKTRGHNMTLWFNLERNIDDLTGNGKLSILTDPKGWDTLFKAPEEVTDFGRGTLLVQHIGSDGKARTVTYTDFLAAKETGTANTRVDIKEEGIYNVALDYMIKNSDLKEALNSTTTYRLSFSFEVKNGSGMVYLFDIGTGSELEEYSRAETGFRIDKANSKSVKVNYVRYAINQKGNALDVRASAPASDGDVFKDVGYYILTMTPEAGVTIEKHIFVGTKADLAQFMEIEPALDKFA